ncbi:uncharacterized protein BO72DRAFT_451995 [Aspergillus fijiensis CBS 313.89]|uniref:Uncharacterized protein n=1 Tax=Aspergillus fijiensis CBS 313.89 TaxID=1448319 RepID=A0A8G1VUJ7_9EURO|nr:uncharacterized protein BO72DRAFT_451995 [Aspergillus fijiensis CBS 313.89]RAK73157.1 hypothetical protein BO72DRAFT_451995 [Aspergillus fijiensis CBS 313.89]
MVKRNGMHRKKMESNRQPKLEPKCEPECEPEQPPLQDNETDEALSIPVLSEYPQRDESPYQTAPITLKVKNEYYTILQYYLRPYARLECNPSDVYRRPRTYNDWSGWTGGETFHLELAIEPRAAHSFIHYLSTGKYETLYSPFPSIETAAEASSILRARNNEEFLRAMHSYAAAVRYEIFELQELARYFLEIFADRLPPEDILRVTSEVYDILGEEKPIRAWLEGFVRGRLELAFMNEEVSLRHIIRDYGIGKQASFDRFIIDETLGIFEREREEASQFIAGLDEPAPVTEPEPESEFLPVPELEPVPEAELEVEVDDGPMPEPAPEPAPEPEALSELESQPLMDSEIKPETEPSLWELQPALQPVQEPEPEASVAMPPLEENDWSAWGMRRSRKTKKRNKKAQNGQEPVEETLQPVAEPNPEVVADEHIL